MVKGVIDASFDNGVEEVVTIWMSSPSSSTRDNLARRLYCPFLTGQLLCQAMLSTEYSEVANLISALPRSNGLDRSSPLKEVAVGGRPEVSETRYMINFGFSSHPEINVRWFLDSTDRRVCPLDLVRVALAFRRFGSRGWERGGFFTGSPKAKDAYKEGGDGARGLAEVRDMVLSSKIRDCVKPTAVFLNRRRPAVNFCACISDDRLDEASEVSDTGEATGDPWVAFGQEDAEDIDFVLRKNVVFGPEGGP